MFFAGSIIAGIIVVKILQDELHKLDEANANQTSSQGAAPISSDTHAAVCSVSQYKDEDGVCRNLTICAENEVEAVSPTSTSDRMCRCIDGYSVPAGGTKCQMVPMTEDCEKIENLYCRDCCLNIETEDSCAACEAAGGM